ncbi:MAG: hypothetical protein Q7K44_04900 [Candidatus Liptonbacteria bacterium]|nr:hypothetical protein [Candidatus Liptonbacteria bacterium]
MKKFIKYQNELTLGAIAIVLLTILIWISIWELGFLAENIGKAINSENSKDAGMNFDLSGAKQLNLKGLAQ